MKYITRQEFERLWSNRIMEDLAHTIFANRRWVAVGNTVYYELDDGITSMEVTVTIGEAKT